MADFKKLEIAFRYHTVQTLIVADGRLFRQEVRALDELNPLMQDKGLMAADGTLAADYDKVRAEAVQTLGSVLDDERKRALIDEFLDVAGVDDDTDDSELTTVFAAAQTLGLTQDDVFAIVSTRRPSTMPAMPALPPMMVDE